MNCRTKAENPALLLVYYINDAIPSLCSIKSAFTFGEHGVHKVSSAVLCSERFVN